MRYRPVGQSGAYPEWIRRLSGLSGVYVIRDAATRACLYVGQSSTGRLRRTLTRHFARWARRRTRWAGYVGPHDPGLVYRRSDVVVAVFVCPAEQARLRESRLIRRLKPAHNLAGMSSDDVPF